MEGKQILALALWFSAFTACGCARHDYEEGNLRPPRPVGVGMITILKRLVRLALSWIIGKI